ncbi:hypothetical protein CCP4SC76_1070005 [Gammaproteobacteria bacterium]
MQANTHTFTIFSGWLEYPESEIGNVQAVSCEHAVVIALGMMGYESKEAFLEDYDEEWMPYAIW